MPVLHPGRPRRRRRRFLGRRFSVPHAVSDPHILPSGERPQNLDGDGTGPKNEGRVAQAIDDGAFETDVARAAVDDGLDPSVQVVEDVCCCSRGGFRGGVGGGGGEGETGEVDQGERKKGGGHADPDCGEGIGDFRCEGGGRGEREEDREWTGPELGDYGVVDGGNWIVGVGDGVIWVLLVSQEFSQLREGTDVDDERVVRRSLLGFVDALDSGAASGVRSESIYGLCGESHGKVL